MKGFHSNLNLHVCVYYPEHKPKCEMIYGTSRVDNQLEEHKHISSCIECAMLEDLCLYAGVHIEPEKVDDKINMKLRANKQPIINKKDVVIGVYNDILYVEDEMMDPEEFFKPPTPVIKTTCTHDNHQYKIEKKWSDFI
ncbi:MAG: hypothetical protein K8E24_014465 [Methanobacterium paludis]|nr:hypothetical protein [Methanobacterium paludis]